MALTLDDKEAIRDVIAAYAHAIDRRDWALMPALFHHDATFGFGPVEGGWRDFVQQARAIIDPCLRTQHQLGQVLIAEEGAGVALTETYMTAMHVVPAGYPAEAFPDRGETYAAVIAGRYIDRFEKRGHEWRIARRLGVYDWREYRAIGEADLAGMPAGACGFHDERDPAAQVVARWRG